MTDTNQKSLTGRALPTQQAERVYTGDRSSLYGEKMILPVDRRAMADEGTYFYFHNATNDAATTVAGHAAPVLADADATMTKPLVFMRNLMATSDKRRLYLDFIEIEVITAGANGTAANWAAQLDTGTTRYSSGGEDPTFVNPNMQSTGTPSSDLAMKIGAVVVGAEGANVRHLGHGQIRAAIEFAGDRTMFRFGGEPDSGANVVAAAASRHLVTLPPVILGPTDQFLLALYAPSQTVAGVYKIKGGFVIR